MWGDCIDAVAFVLHDNTDWKTVRRMKKPFPPFAELVRYALMDGKTYRRTNDVAKKKK